MRFAWSLPMAFTVLALLPAGAMAQEKEVTLKGTILCAKCALKQASKCTTAIVVKEGPKEVTYFFKDKGSQESYHEEVCGGGRKQGTVTGTVSEQGGKKWVTPSKVAYTSTSSDRRGGRNDGKTETARERAGCCAAPVRLVRSCCCCCCCR